MDNLRLKTGSPVSSIGKGPIASPNTSIQPMSPVQPPKTQPLGTAPTPVQNSGHTPGWDPKMMIGTQRAAAGGGAAGIQAQGRLNLLGNIGAQPQPQQQVPSQQGIPNTMNTAMQAVQPQQPKMAKVKHAALHVVGTKKPRNWNHKVEKPSEAKGGITSYGNDAWHTTDRYRRSDSVIGGPPSEDKQAAYAGLAMALHGVKLGGTCSKGKKMKPKVWTKQSTTKEAIGPFQANAAASVAGLDDSIGAMTRNRNEHPGHYWLNPYVHGPLAEMSARLGRRNMATRATGGYGAAIASMIPGPNLVTAAMGGAARKTKARNMYDDNVSEYEEGPGQATHQEDLAKRKKEREKKADNPYKIDQAGQHAMWDKITASQNHNYDQHQGQYFLNPFVGGPLAGGLARMQGRAAATNTHGMAGPVTSTMGNVLDAALKVPVRTGMRNMPTTSVSTGLPVALASSINAIRGTEPKRVATRKRFESSSAPDYRNDERKADKTTAERAKKNKAKDVAKEAALSCYSPTALGQLAAARVTLTKTAADPFAALKDSLSKPAPGATPSTTPAGSGVAAPGAPPAGNTPAYGAVGLGTAGAVGLGAVGNQIMSGAHQRALNAPKPRYAPPNKGLGKVQRFGLPAVLAGIGGYMGSQAGGFAQDVVSKPGKALAPALGGQ